MFTAITWSHYYTAVIILAALWYGIISFVYYRKQMFKLLTGQSVFPDSRKKAETKQSEQEAEDETEHTFDELEGIVTDIRHSILEVAGKEVSKTELLQQLQRRLANYGGLRLPAFRMPLNNFIIQYGESICGVAFSEEELDAAWEALPR